MFELVCDIEHLGYEASHLGGMIKVMGWKTKDFKIIVGCKYLGVYHHCTGAATLEMCALCDLLLASLKHWTCRLE